jgi:two-component system sensor histidine kinase CpxA
VPGLLIAGAVLLLFSLVVADVVRPLVRLAEVVHRFGRGELDARTSVSRRDEIGQLATSFNEMAERLENLVTSERRLLQDVSHELRSPLTRLNIGIQLLRTAADPQQAADRLQREASRLSDLVSTLLEVVRLEREPGSTPTAPLALADVLADSVQGCATEAERRQVTIQVTGAGAGIVDGNAELLRRAFDNVISNAARYAPAGTVVTVCCRTNDGDHVIQVRDSGPGVRDDQLAKLGCAFYRADESRTADTGGVGLGLAIARRALHLHRGTMEIANGHPGLLVTMRLPAEGTVNGNAISSGAIRT